MTQIITVKHLKEDEITTAETILMEAATKTIKEAGLTKAYQENIKLVAAARGQSHIFEDLKLPPRP